MKTTLTELIDKWSDNLKQPQKSSKVWGDLQIHLKFIEDAKLALEKEKHQIKSAYAMGADDAGGPWVDDQCREEWFNSFYKDNEE